MTHYRDALDRGDYLPPAPAEEQTVDQLKQRLKDAGLPVSGTKDELIQRLEGAETAEVVARTAEGDTLKR